MRPNKNTSVFQVTNLKILGRVGAHIFLIIFFRKKNIYNFIHFERHFAFQNAYIFFFRKLEKKVLVSPVNLGRVGLPKRQVFLFGLSIITNWT